MGEGEKKGKREKDRWLKEQLRSVRRQLAAGQAAMTAKALARTFNGAGVDCVAELLDSLAALGQVWEVERRRYVG